MSEFSKKIDNLTSQLNSITTQFVSMELQPDVNSFCEKWKLGIIVGMGGWAWKHVPTFQMEYSLDLEYSDFSLIAEYHDLKSRDLEPHEQHDLDHYQKMLDAWELTIDQLIELRKEYTELVERMEERLWDTKFSLGEYLEDYTWDRFLPCGKAK